MDTHILAPRTIVAAHHDVRLHRYGVVERASLATAGGPDDWHPLLARHEESSRADMKIRPLHDRVLAKRIAEEGKT